MFCGIKPVLHFWICVSLCKKNSQLYRAPGTVCLGFSYCMLLSTCDFLDVKTDPPFMECHLCPSVLSGKMALKNPQVQRLHHRAPLSPETFHRWSDPKIEASETGHCFKREKTPIISDRLILKWYPPPNRQPLGVFPGLTWLILEDLHPKPRHMGCHATPWRHYGYWWLLFFWGLLGLGLVRYRKRSQNSFKAPVKRLLWPWPSNRMFKKNVWKTWQVHTCTLKQHWIVGLPEVCWFCAVNI